MEDGNRRRSAAVAVVVVVIGLVVADESRHQRRPELVCTRTGHSGISQMNVGGLAHRLLPAGQDNSYELQVFVLLVGK